MTMKYSWNMGMRIAGSIHQNSHTTRQLATILFIRTHESWLRVQFFSLSGKSWTQHQCLYIEMKKWCSQRVWPLTRIRAWKLQGLLRTMGHSNLHWLPTSCTCFSLREHLRRWLLGTLGYLSSSLPSWWQLQQDPRPTEMQRRAKWSQQYKLFQEDSNKLYKVSI